jgi:hypothetical protein
MTQNVRPCQPENGPETETILHCGTSELLESCLSALYSAPVTYICEISVRSEWLDMTLKPIYMIISIITVFRSFYLRYIGATLEFSSLLPCITIYYYDRFC